MMTVIETQLSNFRVNPMGRDGLRGLRGAFDDRKDFI